MTTRRAESSPQLVVGFGLAALLVLSACHASHIDLTIENRSGAPIRLLEVDYPSASFGSDLLAAGATMRYRIQVQGSGPLKVLYNQGDGPQKQINGPSLAEHQDGTLEIDLLAGGKAEFHPHLSGAQ